MQLTGKQRASRIPLDYYRRPGGLSRWKVRLAIAAATAASLFLLFEVAAMLLGAAGWSGPATAPLYSRGPLAKVHATWDNDCQACHDHFQPASAQARWAASTLGIKASNEKCQHCHHGARHHPNLKIDEQHCSACHQEHRGRDASLLEHADRQCTHCHADLLRFADQPLDETAVANRADRIMGFSVATHPTFRIHRAGAKDPGNLQFSHQRHMTPGMALQGGGPTFKYRDIRDPALRDRYRPADARDDDFVRLDCAACHTTDGSGGASGQDPARESRAYMQPIRFENHCRACHPLDFDRELPQLQAPHGWQPTQLADWLRGTYSALLVDGQLNDQTIVRPFPGKQLDLKDEKVGGLVSSRVSSAQRALFGGGRACGLCHLGLPDRVEPPDLPRVWLPHARFDHTSHRAITCRDCHARAYATPASDSLQVETVSSNSSKDILIPGIELCVRCHAPRVTTGQVLQGGAGFHCTECHRFHNQGSPLHGAGTTDRSADRPTTVEQFLRGGPRR